MADDAAIAAKYGGTPVDHSAIAAKYGGKPVSVAPQTNGLPLYEFSPYSETRSFLNPAQAPLPVDMKEMRTPKSMAKNFGQGVLDVPRGVANIIPSLAEPEKSIGEPAQQYWQQTKQQFGQGNPSWIANLVNTILAPTMIPQQTQQFAQTAVENPERAAGQAAGMYAMGRAGDVPENFRQGMQGYLRIGKQFIRDEAERVGEENAAALGKHIEKLRDIQEANAQQKGNFVQRQRHIDIADAHARAVADALPIVRQQAIAEGKSMYPKIEATADPAEVKADLEQAASRLQGSTKLPATLKRITDELDKPPASTLLDQATVFKGAGGQVRSGGYSAADAIADMDPKARAKYLESLSPEERAQLQTPGRKGAESAPTGQLSFDKLHGYATELGSAARSSSLLPDERAALVDARTSLLKRMREMADNEGQLAQFQKAQANWKQLENTFNNTSPTAKGGSPIARALQTADPISGKLRPDYVQAILSDDKAFPVAQELLGRYRHLGAPTNELEVMRTNLDAASQLPKSIKWKPEPAEPTLKEFDPVAARKAELKEISRGMGSMKGIRGPLDILALTRVLKGDWGAVAYPILRRAMSSGVGTEGLIRWLSQATPEEFEAAREIPARTVAFNKAELKKLQNRGRP